MPLMPKMFEIPEWGSTEPIPLEAFRDEDLAVLAAFAHQTGFYDLVFDQRSVSLKANGKVGQSVIPLPHYGPILLIIHTKVPVNRLLEWWCWSEGLIDMTQNWIPLEATEDIIEQLGYWLAKRVLAQTGYGLLAAYQRQTEALASPKGRILVRPSVLALAQGKPQLTCRYEERRHDIAENQALLWTLDCLRRYGLRHPQIRQQVQAAYRVLQGNITLKPFTSKDCRLFNYTRLNQHYEHMHRLCAMILSQVSINQQRGEHSVPSFILSMSQVFEGAVANGLKHLLKDRAFVNAQEAHTFSVSPPVQTRMDLVIRSLETLAPLMVLDTKYKHGSIPNNSDVYQVVAYATALGVQEAILLYPHELSQPLTCQIGGVTCKSLSVPMLQPVLRALESLAKGLQYLQT